MPQNSGHDSCLRWRKFTTCMLRFEFHEPLSPYNDNNRHGTKNKLTLGANLWIQIRGTVWITIISLIVTCLKDFFYHYPSHLYSPPSKLYIFEFKLNKTRTERHVPKTSGKAGVIAGAQHVGSVSSKKKHLSNQVVYWYCRFVFFLSCIIFQWCLLVSWKDSHTYLQTSNSQSGDLQMFRTSVRFIHGMDYRRQQEQRLPTESDITDFL